MQRVVNHKVLHFSVLDYCYKSKRNDAIIKFDSPNSTFAHTVK